MLHDISSSFFVSHLIFISQKWFTSDLQTAPVTQWKQQSIKCWRHKNNLLDQYVNMFIIIIISGHWHLHDQLFDHSGVTETSCKHTDVSYHYTVLTVSADKRQLFH